MRNLVAAFQSFVARYLGRLGHVAHEFKYHLPAVDNPLAQRYVQCRPNGIIVGAAAAATAGRTMALVVVGSMVMTTPMMRRMTVAFLENFVCRLILLLLVKITTPHGSYGIDRVKGVAATIHVHHFVGVVRAQKMLRPRVDGMQAAQTPFQTLFRTLGTNRRAAIGFGAHAQVGTAAFGRWAVDHSVVVVVVVVVVWWWLENKQKSGVESREGDLVMIGMRQAKPLEEPNAQAGQPQQVSRG
mmetsp:Transcript_11445/g.25497  ORF Transcript_11445/g.25497 Transcript_11445/m.25497 type:complete len:242 (+) Transcript_11445:1348-2073(+)